MIGTELRASRDEQSGNNLRDRISQQQCASANKRRWSRSFRHISIEITFERRSKRTSHLCISGHVSQIAREGPVRLIEHVTEASRTHPVTPTKDGGRVENGRCVCGVGVLDEKEIDNRLALLSPSAGRPRLDNGIRAWI